MAVVSAVLSAVITAALSAGWRLVRLTAAWLAPALRRPALWLALAAAGTGAAAGWTARGRRPAAGAPTGASGLLDDLAHARYRADIRYARAEADGFRDEAEQHLRRAEELEQLLAGEFFLPPLPESPSAHWPKPPEPEAPEPPEPESLPPGELRLRLERAERDLDALRNYAYELELRREVQERREAALREALDELRQAHDAQAFARAAAERRADLAEARAADFGRAAEAAVEEAARAAARARFPFAVGPTCARSFGGPESGWHCGIGVTLDLGRAARLLF